MNPDMRHWTRQGLTDRAPQTRRWRLTSIPAAGIVVSVLAASLAPVASSARTARVYRAHRAQLSPLAGPGRLTQYRIIDLGTFGGPSAFQNSPGRSLANGDVAIGEADTSVLDPNAPICFSGDCYIAAGFMWQRGRLVNLGALPGPNSSCPTWINDRGEIAGDSEVGVDQSAGNALEHAVLWNGGRIIDLGTLGGVASDAGSVNDRGQVAGSALNAVPDPLSNDFTSNVLGPNCAIIPPTATEVRAFLWQDGAMRDLGTLGGPDSGALWINNRAAVAGVSYTDATPNLTTGFPAVDPFLWTNGTMRDLGTLGGTSGTANALNERGQVAGTSNLAGDQTHHAFLWTGGVLRDLGTLGGDNSEAFAINSTGEVVGRADFSPGVDNHHAFLWKNGTMLDLGVVDGGPNTTAYGVNDRGQVIGDASGEHAWLWQDGTMRDLNDLVVPGSSDISVTAAAYINDRGVIYGSGVLPNGDEHVILLIPSP
jgi:probable HAF family extracellular repeat protein